jgi:excisionase family DNA binding protein
MTLSADRTKKFIAPTAEDATLARASSRTLASYVQNKQPYCNIRIMQDDTTGESVAIPAAAFCLLVDILAQMAQGNAVTLIPVKKELTTQEAADILQVSRPYLVGLLESGEIPYRKVGTRRRVKTQDLIDYKNWIDAQRMHSLEELAAQAQELNMGY